MSVSIDNYRDSGVDIEAGEDFARFIQNFSSEAISSSIGSFSGAYELDLSSYKKPVLLSSTDGVGTKILVAKRLGIYDSIGIDLVAMCVNDLIVSGAEPLFFLDYIACGSVKKSFLEEIMKGIITGCEASGAQLSGGETAEMPDLYSEDSFDLAGFTVGLVEKDKLLPKPEKIKTGDPVFGFQSSGIHSNGFSLARKALENACEESWKTLLEPTIIYVRHMKPILRADIICSAAHITGGGLYANLKRVLPEGLKPLFYWNWPIPEIFGEIQKSAAIEDNEMRKVFNMGIGIAMVCPKDRKNELIDLTDKNGISILEIGEIVDG